MTSVRRLLHALFTISIPIVMLLQFFVVQDKITPIRVWKNFSISKWWILFFSVLLFIVTIFIWLFKIGIYGQWEENGETSKQLDFKTKNILHCTSNDIFISIAGIAFLDMLYNNIISWHYASPIYSYSILWFCVIPIVSAMLELAGNEITWKKDKLEETQLMRKALTKNSIITIIGTIINLIVLIWTANMSVCGYLYIIYIVLLILRATNMTQIENILSARASDRDIPDVDKKEGIL